MSHWASYDKSVFGWLRRGWSTQHEGGRPTRIFLAMAMSFWYKSHISAKFKRWKSLIILFLGRRCSDVLRLYAEQWQSNRVVGVQSWKIHRAFCTEQSFHGKFLKKINLFLISLIFRLKISCKVLLAVSWTAHSCADFPKGLRRPRTPRWTKGYFHWVVTTIYFWPLETPTSIKMVSAFCGNSNDPIFWF